MPETKYDLPDEYIDEKNEYLTLKDLGIQRTVTGSFPFISSTSGTDYSVTTGGQEAVMQKLKTKIHPYTWFAIDANEKANQSDLDTTNATLTGHINNFTQHYAIGTATSLNNAYTFTTTVIPTAYVNLMSLLLIADKDSTGSCTINWNSLGAVGLKNIDGTDVSLKTSGIYSFRYSSSKGYFELQGGGSGSGIGSQIISAQNLSSTNLISDVTANSTQSISVAGSTTTSTTIFTYDILNPVFGDYSLIFRMKSSLNAATGILVQIQTSYISGSNTIVLNTGTIKGTEFLLTNTYQTFAMKTSCKYTSKTSGDKLRIIVTIPILTTATTINVDYMSIAMATVGAFPISTT